MTARSDDLQISTINRLKAALDLPDDGGVIPVAIAQQRDDLDPRVSVGASISSSARNNKLQEVNATARVIVDGTQRYVDKNGTLGLSRILSDVVDEMTTHTESWYAAGVNSEEEVAWNDELNRYLAVSEFGVESNETKHPIYQED